MADLNPEVVQKFEQMLIDAGKSANDVKKTMETLEKAAKKAGIALGDLEKFDKELKKNTKTMGGVFAEMLTQQKKYKELASTLDDLNDKIEDMESNIDKANDADKIALRLEQEKLIAQRQSLQQVVQHNAAVQASANSVRAFGQGLGQIAGIASKTLGGFAKGLQDGSGAFTLAGGLMEGAIDGINAGAHVATGAMSAAGQAMETSTSPKIKKMGMVAQVAGTALNGVADAAAQASKFIVGFMMKELEKTVEAFNKTSAAGAMFADGMTGMRNTAGDAGLTIQQFSSVVSANKEKFAESGLGVGEATKKMGLALQAGGKGMQTSLLKLGYSYEEQAGLVADVMSDMRKSRSSQLNDPQAIAAATEDYAKNLRTIAAITGDDAKARLEQTRKESANVAFRNKLMELEKQFPGITRRTMDSMALLNTQQQQNVRETVLFGGVINKTGAIIDSSSSSMNDLTKSVAGSITNGTVTIDQTSTKLGQSMDKFNANGELNAIGMAGAAGKLTDVNQALSQYQLDSDRISEKGVKAAKESVDAQMHATDALTTSTVNAAEQAQDLALKLQKLVLPQLDNFSKLAGEFLKAISDSLDALDDVNGKQEAENWKYMTWWEKGLTKVSQLVEMIEDVFDMLSGGLYSKVTSWLGIGSAKENREDRIKSQTEEAVKRGGKRIPTANDKANAVEQAGPPAPSGQVTVQGAPATAPAEGATPAPAGGSVPAVGAPGSDSGATGGANKVSQMDLSKAGFKLKAGDVQADGAPVSSGILSIAKKIQESFPGFAYFSSFNDKYHQQNAPTSQHAQGKAIDFALAKPPTDEEGKALVGQLKQMGATLAIDEYNHPSGKATGGHMHVQMADNGASLGPDDVAIVGEKGPEIVQGSGSVTSRASSSEIFNKMNANLETMIRLLKAQHGTSEKILMASS